MDRQFLEFWGNFLLSAAKGHRQVDDMSRWMAQGMKGVQDLNDMFRKVYGLEQAPGSDPDMLTSAQSAFQNGYKTYLEAMGVVPKSDYTALKRQFEALQQQAEEHETTIRNLRMELSECKLSQGDTVRGFQELIQVQSDQFRELTDSFGRFFSGSADDEEKKP
ncbi:hypothetical protein D3OALGA1CA_3457 [Olavius algarvensis associated proteobacterium Delta 3]|nr:hypothetical protein D3OALGB2SA_3845 [Olavius algarvensis associated proteobacterium Delta 3]CAB5134688.1 hypothetical protein D3OALGA1CA_3457 [Olavius algarvensis associated proteobacterium Delta 3]